MGKRVYPQEEKLDRETVERWRHEAVTAPAQDRLWLNRCEALCNALAQAQPDRPLTTGEGSGLDKTPAELLAEMRAFALTLPDDLGSLFGRDVARMCDECGRLRGQLEAARQALTYIAGYQSETQSDAEGVTLMQAAARAALGVGDG